MKRLVLTFALTLLAADLFAAEALTKNKRDSWLNSFLSGGGIGAEPFAADPVACDSTIARRRYYNTTSHVEYVCDGTAWRPVILQGSTGTAGAIVNADINAAAAISRSKLAEDALQVHQVDLKTATFTSLAGSEAAGTFNEKVDTNVIKLEGEVTDNETETSVGYFRFILPPAYVAAGDVTIRFRSALVKSGAPTNNGSTLDLECYEQADAAVGSDLVATAAATYAALDTYYSKDFSVTATGLVAGDILNCKVTTAVVDSEAGAGTITWTSDPVKVLIDIKG